MRYLSCKRRSVEFFAENCKLIDEICQATVALSGFYVMAAAVCVSRVGRSRVRLGWSGLGVTGHRGREPFVASAACMGRDVRA